MLLSQMEFHLGLCILSLWLLENVEFHLVCPRMNPLVRQQAYQLTLSPCLGTQTNVSLTKVHSRKTPIRTHKRSRCSYHLSHWTPKWLEDSLWLLHIAVPPWRPPASP